MVKKLKNKMLQKKRSLKVMKKSNALKVSIGKKVMLKSMGPNLKKFKNYKDFLKYLMISDDFDCEPAE